MDETKEATRRNLPRPLNYRQLEAFRTVMITGGMTEAGDVMGVTQPAVSRLIRDLEVDLGLILFHRHGNRITPTREARILFRDVERLFIGSEQLRETAALIRESGEERLRIAAMPSLVQGFLPRVIGRFLVSHPDVACVLHSDTSMAITDLVPRWGFDVGFAYASSVGPGIDVRPLPQTEAVCVVPTAFPIASREEIHAHELSKVPIISLGPNSVLYMQILSTLRAACPDFSPRIQTRYPWTACSLAAEGLGVAIVDPFTAHEVHDPRVVFRPFRPRIFFAFSALLVDRDNRPAIAGEFLDTFVEVLTEEFLETASKS